MQDLENMNGVGRAAKTMKEGERAHLLIQPQCACLCVVESVRAVLVWLKEGEAGLTHHNLCACFVGVW